MSAKTINDGAVDFLPKPSDAYSLLCAIELAIERSSCMSKAEADKEAIKRRLDTLTPREHECLAG